MNAILLVAALLGTNDQSEADRVLRCSADRKGRFVVTERQWKFVREHLTPEKVGVLLHPKHGVNIREAMGTHAVWQSWNHRDWILASLTSERLKPRWDSDPNPFVGLMSWFHTSTKLSKLEIRKLDYRTWELVPSDAWIAESRKKFGPVEFIRLMRADRRLWLGEYGHTIEAE